MSVMFFKDAGGADTPHSSSMVANALQQLQVNRGLRAVLIIVGVLLILYGESTQALNQTGCTNMSNRTTHHCTLPVMLVSPNILPRGD